MQQELAAAEADDAAEVGGGGRVFALVEHVQQGQRRAEAPAGPGRAIADRGGDG